MKVSIVGMDGSNLKRQLLQTKKLFNSMVRCVGKKVGKGAELISGGNAWSEHVAVTLYLRERVTGLELCLPCEWDYDKKQFVDNGSRYLGDNPGRMMNQHHLIFSKVLGKSTLSEIQAAKDKGAVFRVYSGSRHAADKAIAEECDKLICLTWGGFHPTAGCHGIKWGACNKPKEHISLLVLNGVPYD